MNKLILVGAALMFASPALAQSNTPAEPRQPGPPVLSNPVQPAETVVKPGGPGVANGGPASTGSIAHSGTGADSITNNPGADLNAGAPERAVPNTGGGGGGGDSSGGN